MTREQIGRREKLITAWRAFAQGLMNLGYDPSEVLETMATVARNDLNESDQAAPRQVLQEEGRVDVRLPPATWDFTLNGRVAEH
jgi:Holliday junction resolvasome RuvABC DNA-binding subunit